MAKPRTARQRAQSRVNGRKARKGGVRAMASAVSEFNTSAHGRVARQAVRARPGPSTSLTKSPNPSTIKAARQKQQVDVRVSNGVRVKMDRREYVATQRRKKMGKVRDALHPTNLKIAAISGFTA